MYCPNCGTENNQDSKFCIKCGQSLINNPSSTVEQPTIKQENSTVQSVSNEIPVSTTSANNNNENIKVSLIGYLFIIVSVILKPFTAFKEELNKFNKFKNSAILSLIVSVIAIIIKLITVMINTVAVKSFDWKAGGYKTVWEWENLKNLNYVEVIGKYFLIYFGIIIVIATVFYIISLIIKKQTNFSRLLGISALAVIPALCGLLILSPLLSMIWAELAMPISLIGIIYTIVLLYETMNSEIILEGNMKYYFNLVCFSILGIAAYYLYMKVMVNTTSSGLENLLDIFGE